MKKVAIVGVEGSGKTVMLAGLGELYSQPDAQGYFLAPKNFETANYVTDKIERMRRGEWPSATAGDELQGLDWTLKRKVGEGQRPESVCVVSFLDFAGEVYRVAFGVSEKPELADEAESLKSYIRNADDVIVLINLSDIITHGLADTRVRESMWITNGILEFALDDKNGRKVPRAAIVLSQADSYADTIAACGGVRGVLKTHLSHVANNYDWLDLMAANAVDRTVLDDDGLPAPAPDFKTTGLQPIMDWIIGGLATGNPLLKATKPLAPSQKDVRPGKKSTGATSTATSQSSKNQVNVVSFALSLLTAGIMGFVCFVSGHWGIGILMSLAFCGALAARGDKDFRQGFGWWFLHALLVFVSGLLGVFDHGVWSALVALCAYGTLVLDDKDKKK